MSEKKVHCIQSNDIWNFVIPDILELDFKSLQKKSKGACVKLLEKFSSRETTPELQSRYIRRLRRNARIVQVDKVQYYEVDGAFKDMMVLLHISDSNHSILFLGSHPVQRVAA